jgi:hypothetical protein
MRSNGQRKKRNVNRRVSTVDLTRMTSFHEFVHILDDTRPVATSTKQLISTINARMTGSQTSVRFLKKREAKRRRDERNKSNWS